MCSITVERSGIMSLLLFYRLESAIPLLQRKLAQLPDTDNVAIAFPDDGAHKRFSNYFTEQPTIICFKIREGEKRIVKIKDGKARREKMAIKITGCKAKD